MRLSTPLCALSFAAACSPAVDLASAADGTTTAGTTTAAPPTTSPDDASTSAPDTSTSTTATPPLSTASGDPDPTDECTFLACDPDVPTIASCNFLDNDCPEGEKCTFWANDGGNHLNATRCVPVVMDPAGPEEACTVEGHPLSGFDTCDYASVCWYLDIETGEGLCMPLCQGSEDNLGCDDPTRDCSVGGDLVPAFCLPRCNPLDPRSCPAGLACYTDGDGLACAPDASGPNAGALFDTCSFTNACDPGLSCAPADAVGQCEPETSHCCTPWCDLAAPDCPAGTVCIPSTLPDAEETLGQCGQEPR